MNAPGALALPYHDSFCFDGKEARRRVSRAPSNPRSPRSASRADAVVQQIFDLMPILEGVYDIGSVLAVRVNGRSASDPSASSPTRAAFKQSGRTSGAVKWTNLEQWRSTEKPIER